MLGTLSQNRLVGIYFVLFGLVLFHNPNSLEVGQGGGLGVFGEFLELFSVNGLMFVSRGDVCGGELRVDSDTELSDSRLDLRLHLLLGVLLALSDKRDVGELVRLWRVH